MGSCNFCQKPCGKCYYGKMLKIVASIRPNRLESFSIFCSRLSMRCITGLLGWTLGKSVSKAGGRGSLVSFIRYCRFTCDRDSCSTLRMGERSLDSLGGVLSVFELYRSLFSATFLRQLSLVCCIKRHAGEQDMLSCKSEN